MTDNKTKILLTFNHDHFLNNIIIICLLLFIAFLVIYFLSLRYKASKGYLFLLLCYHSAISFFLYYSTLRGIADCRSYYFMTVMKSSYDVELGYSVQFIYYFLFPFVHIFKMTYFSCTFLFNIIGYIGLAFLYAGLYDVIKDSKKAVKYLQMAIFIPGLSYWTGFIGKDPLISFCICLVIFSIINLKTRLLLFISALVLMTLTRPYSSAITLMSLLIGVLLTGQIKILYKTALLVIIMIGTIFAAKIFVQSYGLEGMSLNQGGKLIGSTQFDWGGGSGIDISNYNIVFKILTFLYRPLFFDAHNIMSLISSCENLIYIYLTFSLLTFTFLHYYSKEKSLLFKFNLIFFIMGVIFLAQTNSNLGTVVRKKIMILPSLITIFVMYIAQRDRQRVNQIPIRSRRENKL
jgi:hypothetical protein